MIRLTDRRGDPILIQPDQIATITTASTSQAWHGVRANIQRTVDGQWIEVLESVDQIQGLLQQEKTDV